ncbi:MAG TPA: NAD(P)H-dependent oxidoreductase [Bacilli bacterium]|nr:NAD(P)H-dependent oxidoreductase [Bacilli bacterium]
MKLVAFSSSLSQGSNSLKALKIAVEAARQAGAEVELFNLREQPLPIYDPEDEGQKANDENVAHFIKIMTEADGFLLASPEYHNGPSGAFKNALDFISSTQFKDKPVGLIAAAGGAIATNTLNQMITILRSLHAHVVPQVGSVGFMDAFDEAGNLTNAKAQERFEKIGIDTAKMARLLREMASVQ